MTTQELVFLVKLNPTAEMREKGDTAGFLMGVFSTSRKARKFIRLHPTSMRKRLVSTAYALDALLEKKQ